MLTKAEKQRILKRHPESMSKEQFYKLCHITKSSARRLLEDGIVPCQIKPSATHKYVIATKDVICYLERRLQTQQEPEQPERASPTPTRQSHPAPKLKSGIIPKELRDCLLPVIENALSSYPDVMKLAEVSEAIGYSPNSLLKWCKQGRIRSIKTQAYLIPKPWLINFMLTIDFLNMRCVSGWHRQTIHPVINAYLRKHRT